MGILSSQEDALAVRGAAQVCHIERKQVYNVDQYVEVSKCVVLRKCVT